MLPNSLSIVDLADIGWEKIATNCAFLCVRSPLQTKSGSSLDVSVCAWISELRTAGISPSQKSDAAARWGNLHVSNALIRESGFWEFWKLSGPESNTFVAVIPSELFLDRILSEYGPPPTVILRDWNRQVSSPSNSLLLDQPLSCIAIGRDGLLHSITDFGTDNCGRDSRKTDSSLNPHSNASQGQPILDAASIEQLDKFVDLLATCGALTKAAKTQNTSYCFTETRHPTLREFLKTQNLEGKIVSPNGDSANSILPSSSFSRADTRAVETPAVGLLASASPVTPKHFASKDSKPSFTPKLERSPAKRFAFPARRTVPSIIVLLTAAIGLGFLLIPATSTRVADSGRTQHVSGTKINTEASSPSVDLITSADSLAPENDATSTPNASDTELKITEGISTSEVSAVPTLNADLASELSAKLTQGITDDIDGNSVIDPTKIESITSLLTPKDAAANLPIEIESRMTSDRDLKSLDASFSDSADANTASMDPAIPKSETAENESPAVDVPIASDEQTGISKVVSIVLKRPVQKEELRIPFSVNAKTASVQVQWELPEEILITPEAPVMMTGKQEQTWTIALKDESSKLVVTVKSKPNRKWLLGTVVKLAGENGMEFPIAPGDAKLIQQQLIARSKELTKQTQFLELVKGAKGGRAFASYYMPLAESSLKQTDLAIQQWLEIDDLVNQFYHSHKLNLTFYANANMPLQ
ncbi:MAG: hypothetical protein NTW52_16685 [Planctomycetota bacterium]|nr:hypothetical protein [Planctomycetota bacterium]